MFSGKRGSHWNVFGPLSGIRPLSGSILRLQFAVNTEVDLRSTNYAINKNKGLTRKRKKEDRNARVKNRNRFERAVKRRKGAVQEVREASADGIYSGEATGLRTNVRKSVKLG